MLIDSSLFERIYFHLRFCTSMEYSFDMFINGNGALFFHTSPSLPLLQDNDVSLFYGNIILSYVMFRVLGIQSRGFFSIPRMQQFWKWTLHRDLLCTLSWLEHAHFITQSQHGAIYISCTFVGSCMLCGLILIWSQGLKAIAKCFIYPT